MALLMPIIPRTAAACAGSSLAATARSVTPTMRRCCAWAEALKKERAMARTDTRQTVRLSLRGGAPVLIAIGMPEVELGYEGVFAPSAYNLVGLYPDYVDQFLDGASRLVELGLLLRRQLDLEELLAALRAQLHGHAHEQIVDAIFALQEHRARHDLFLVLQDRFDHERRRGARRIPGARADQLGDFGAAVGGALADRLDAVRRKQFGNRNAGHRGEARQRAHRVGAAAQDG